MRSSRHPHHAPRSVTAPHSLPSVEKLRRRIQRARQDGHPNKAERLQARLDTLLQPKVVPTLAQKILAAPVQEPELWERVEFEPIVDEPHVEVRIVSGLTVDPTEEPDYSEVINSLPLPVAPEEDDDPYSELQDSSPQALLRALETLASTIRANPETLSKDMLEFLEQDIWPAFASEPMAGVPAISHPVAAKNVCREIVTYLAKAPKPKGRIANFARSSLVALHRVLAEHLSDYVAA